MLCVLCLYHIPQLQTCSSSCIWTSLLYLCRALCYCTLFCIMEGCIWTKTELTPLEENVSGRPLWGCYRPEGLQLGLITHTHVLSAHGPFTLRDDGFHYWPGLQRRCRCLSPCFLDFLVGCLSLGQTPQVCAVPLLPALPSPAPDRTPCVDSSLVLLGSVDGPLLTAHGPLCAVLWDCSESVLSFFFFLSSGFEDLEAPWPPTATPHADALLRWKHVL